MAEPEDTGFLSRWSRRKTLLRERGTLPAEPADPGPPAAPAPVAVVAPPPAASPAADAPAPDREAPPPPTLDDVAALTPASDFRRFVAPDVDTGVRNAALKKLFTDPQYNLMDGLDIYIDDYGRPDPLPAGMLERMAQSQFLNLFADAEAPAPDTTAAAPAAADETPPDEDPDLRLQPHDAAGPGGAEPGPEPDPGRER